MANSAVLVVFILSLCITIPTDFNLLIIIQAATLITAGAITHLTYRTYKMFGERDLFIGFLGFATIFSMYLLFFALYLFKFSSVEIEAALNTAIMFGYALVTIASGWLK